MFKVRHIESNTILEEEFFTYEAADYAARVYSSYEGSTYEVV